MERAEFDRVAVFLYSDEEGTGAVGLDEKVERDVMDERRNAILSIQESISAAKGRAKVGSILEVLIDGRSEETEHVLEGRHEGLAPEIDGVVYIDEGPSDTTSQRPARHNVSSPTPGDFCKVEITDAAAFDLVGTHRHELLCATDSPAGSLPLLLRLIATTNRGVTTDVGTGKRFDHSVDPLQRP